MPEPSIISPIGYSHSTCGYCSPKGKRSQSKSSASYGFWAHQLSVEVYDTLMNRGWRRSGMYLYHPDIARTCCPQLTIRLASEAYRPGRHAKKLENRFNRWLLTGSTDHPPSRKPGKGRHNQPFNLLTSLEASVSTATAPSTEQKPAHTFRTSLHASSPPHPDVHPLYVKYQTKIHGDSPTSSSLSLDSFKRFLCTSPLSTPSIPYPASVLPRALSPSARKKRLDELGLPEHYGTWHLLYWLDDEIVGFSVLDIVPSGVSSVYFVYSPDKGDQGWGTLSVLREIGLSQKMVEAGVVEAKYVYLGYYIHKIPKMRYKGDFKPAQLLDPETNVYHPLAPLVPHLEARPTGYFSFASPPPLPITPVASVSSTARPSDDTSDKPTAPAESSDGSEAEDDEPERALPSTPPPPSFLSTKNISMAAVQEVIVMVGAEQCCRLKDSPYKRHDQTLGAVRELVASLHGPEKTENDGSRGLLSAPSEFGLVVVAV